MQTLRLGIIGAGRIVQILAGQLVREDNPFTVTAIAETNPRTAAATAADLRVKGVFSDYRELLRLSDIDAVYIATPPFLHRTMVADALAAEKHVICEKPFALTLAEVRELAAASAAHPRLKVGCCSSRFHDSDTTRRARDLIREGHLGTPYRLTFLSVAPAWPPGATAPAWKNDPLKAGGGISFSWGVYDLGRGREAGR